MHSYNASLLDFLNEATDPFHAVLALSNKLDKAGFTALSREQNWSLKKGQGYYVTENGSSIIAFIYQDQSKNGLRLVGTHTDSPCLKLKPNPLFTKDGYTQLGVEVYGGMMMAPWFDRDLSLSGRVSYENSKGVIQHSLINFQRPIAFIPNLAIHLNRNVNKEHPINPETELMPIISTAETDLTFHELLMAELKRKDPKHDCKKIHSFELSLYDTAPARLVGLNEAFIASARLDNLLSCFAGVDALINTKSDQFSLLVCNDHEEVGSQSTSGASGPFLYNTLKRLMPNIESREQILAKSTLISVDNAHAIHPNYADKHDKYHAPHLNKGPVIKVNSNQRYASNSQTIAYFKALCEKHDIPYQIFASRNDVSCGTTIGPLTATRLGIKTLDIGAPQYAMHSIRELTGAKDAYLLSKALSAFYTD